MELLIRVYTPTPHSLYSLILFSLCRNTENIIRRFKIQFILWLGGLWYTGCPRVIRINSRRFSDGKIRGTGIMHRSRFMRQFPVANWFMRAHFFGGYSETIIFIFCIFFFSFQLFLILLERFFREFFDYWVIEVGQAGRRLERWVTRGIIRLLSKLFAVECVRVWRERNMSVRKIRNKKKDRNVLCGEDWERTPTRDHEEIGNVFEVLCS